MDIVLIGSGNAATILGRKCLQSGHRIIQVYSPTLPHAITLSNLLGARAISTIGSIVRNADLMLLAIKDDAIGRFAHAIGSITSVVAHTAGAVNISELEGTSDRTGVVYPLQSLRKEMEIIPPLTLLVNGNGSNAINALLAFSHSISETVLQTNDTDRLKYHLAATIVNNFTNYLYKMAADYCMKEQISFRLLQPLIEETALRLRKTSPGNAQTGPAARNDIITMNKHLQLLAEYPDLLEFYELFSRRIQEATPGRI